MASAQPASAFPCLSLQLACLLLGAWLAFDAHGGGQAVAPPARVEARVPTAATDDWGRQPDSSMRISMRWLKKPLTSSRRKSG